MSIFFLSKDKTVETKLLLKSFKLMSSFLYKRFMNKFWFKLMFTLVSETLPSQETSVLKLESNRSVGPTRPKT